jgi:glycine oxidase
MIRYTRQFYRYTQTMSSRVAIVGGGLIGCTAALELARAGHRVELYERDEIGRAASWAAGGVLTPVHIADYPGPLAELCVASQDLYPAFVASLEAPQVEFAVSGLILLILDDADERDAQTMLEWRRARRLPTSPLTPEEARRQEPWITPDLRGALLLPEIAQVRNHRLTQAAAQAARRAGVTIHTRAPVKDPLGLPADRVVLAAGCWSSGLAPGIDVRPARGQMILLAAPPGSIRRILLWKDRYIIPRRDGRLLLGSTVEDAGFDCTVTPEGLSAIRADAARIAPRTADLPVERTWAGLRPRTPDRLPILGAQGSMIFATGHFRNGILLAPITGRLIREILEDRTPSIRLDPFRPDRFAR